MTNFGDIGPYEGKDFEEAVERLVSYPQLLDNFTDIICRKARVVNAVQSFRNKYQLSDLLKKVHNYTEFQEKITCDFFLNMIETSSIDKFTFSGMPEDNRPHIYISNHRDIVLDTALLDLALYRSNKSMCEMIIGDNLLVNRFSTDMFKVNGAITTRRNLSSTSELREETLRMSRYVKHVIQDKKKSVWVAQKSGRSKDGKDDTSSAIIKMLYLAYREEGLSFEEFLKQSSIIPVAISYQYDPCDVSKSHEVIRSLKNEGCYNVYVKKKYADLLDLVRGLRLYKGNVHIQLGSELPSDLPDARAATAETDRQIHMNYRLWDTNYFCYDYLENKNGFAEKYKDFNGKKFLKKYKNHKPEVVAFVLNGYANPVRSKLNEENA